MTTLYATAQELLGLAIPGFPSTKRGINKLATRDGWPFRRRAALGGTAIEYPVLIPNFTSNDPSQVRSILTLEQQAHVRAILAEREAIGAGPNAHFAYVNAKLATLDPKHAVQGKGVVDALTPADAPRTRMEARLELISIWERWRAERVPPISQEASQHLFSFAYNHQEVEAPGWVRDLVPKVSASSLYVWRKAMKRGGPGALSLKGDVRRATSSSRARKPSARENKRDAGPSSACEEVARPNQLWEMGASPLDFILADGQRYTIVGVTDVFSRRLMLYVGRTPKATPVPPIFRRALLAWGWPESVKTEGNFNDLSQNVKDVFRWNGIRPEIREPRHKPHIDAAFHTFARTFLEMLPGFTLDEAIQREAIALRASFAENLTKRDSKVTIEMEFLSAEELQAYCERWCEEFHQRHVLAQFGKTSEQLVAEAALSLRRVGNPRELDTLLTELPRASYCIVGKNGIHVGGFVYDAPELRTQIRQRVRLRHDPHDLGRLVVFSEADGSFVCVAECPELLAADPAEIGAKAREMRQSRAREMRQAARAFEPDEILARIHPDETVGSYERHPGLEHGQETQGEPPGANVAQAALLGKPGSHYAKARQAKQEDFDLFDWEEALRLEKELAAKGVIPSEDYARLEHLRRQRWYAGIRPTLEQLGIITDET